ncbi:YihY/virulence factor BrkB family protein [Candidatus Halobonum tyrrellensis]|uniref:Uncharacterized protein n=1 Tax=Candidatus Halobonum tyrrellensis G22 TaxID=1324957 RepID=V4GU29_9EURY|nr:YihY/virulence factor BrkB family protein [Candidatus Halobonum tyrrellensis]ESP88636.1 hypothetical protein K933_07973 [Candidatus Halobonum tyrrellensis G22]
MSNDGTSELVRDDPPSDRADAAEGDPGEHGSRADAASGGVDPGRTSVGVPSSDDADDLHGAGTLKRMYVAVRRADVTFIAGSLAYHSIVAVLPAVVFAFVALFELSGEVVARNAVAVAGDVLTPVGRTFLRDALTDVSRRRGILVVSVGLMCFAAVQLFRGFDRAFAAVYGAEERGALNKATDAVYAFLVGSLGVAAVLIAGGTLSVYANANTSLAHVAVPAGVFALSVATLWPLYHGLPAVKTTWRETLPGTVFTATGWAVAGAGFGLYAASDAAVGIYGVLGGLALLLLWFYVAHVLLLVGAALNAVAAGRIGGE